MFPMLRRRLDGPPLALPAVVDRVAERWWGARPRTRALVVVVALTTVVVAGVAHAAASPHGPPTPVLVAARDLPVGHVLAPGDLRRAHWPRDLVPAGATTRLEGTVVGPLPRGAVATDRHVAAAGVAAAIPRGRVAVAVPGELLPDVPAGVRLDAVTADADGQPPGAGPEGGRARRGRRGRLARRDGGRGSGGRHRGGAGRPGRRGAPGLTASSRRVWP
jgi:hypothetical protein